MTYYAGIDVSLETSSICIVDAQGAIRREFKVESEPEVMAAALVAINLAFSRIGLEAGRYRSGFTLVLPRRACRSCFWKPGSCAPRRSPCRSRPTGTTRGRWRRWCAAAGSRRCT